MKEKFKEKMINNLSFFKTMFFTILTMALLFSVVFSNVLVPSSSMFPTINTGDRIVGCRLAYIGKKTPQRGDIITFDYPDDPKLSYIKRCVGLPGETIQVKEGALYINDELYNEPYNAETYFNDTEKFYVPKKGDVVTTESNEGIEYCYINDIFVGNNNFLFKYCELVNERYIVTDDCYFMLGDNVNNSLDARFWNNKYVTENEITSKACFSYFPTIKNLK